MPLRAEIRFRAKTIVTSLSRDSYWHCPPKSIIIKFSLTCNTCVIMFLPIKINSVKYKRFRDGRCTYKNTGSSHLNLLTLSFFLLTLKQFFVKVYGYIFNFENDMRSSRLRRSLARSRETRFTRPNRRACLQARGKFNPVSFSFRIMLSVC